MLQRWGFGCIKYMKYCLVNMVNLFASLIINAIPIDLANVTFVAISIVVVTNL